MELILKMKNRYYRNILKLDIIKKIIKNKLNLFNN